MKRIITTILLTTLPFLTACAKDAGMNKGSTPNSKNGPVVSTKNVVQKVRELLNSEKGDCNFLSKYKGCTFEDVKLSKNSGSESSEGQRILILDSFFLPPSTFGRYRNRLLEINYLADSNRGLYRTWEPEAKVPELLMKALKLLPESILIRELSEVSNELNRLHFKIKVSNYPKEPSIGHGEPIFNWLAELHPRAQFVLAEFPYPSEEILCALDSPFGRRAFAKFYQSAAANISMMVRKHEINFVNISYAPTDATLAEHYERSCGKSYDNISRRDREMLQLHRSTIITGLARDHEDLLIAQAVPNQSNSTLELDDREAPFICNTLPQSIKVGHFAERSMRETLHGTEISMEYVPHSQRKSYECTDLYINGGMTEATQPGATEPLGFDEYSLHQNYNGVLLSPEPYMATSWATPLALSMAITVKQAAVKAGEILMPSDIKDRLSKKMWDPLRTNSFDRIIPNKEKQ